MVGLNSLNYIAMGYEIPSQGLDFRFAPTNTRMWFENINDNFPHLLDVTPDDNHFVFVSIDNNIVLLKKDSSTPSQICNYYRQVKSGTNCINCFNPDEFSNSSELCNGNSNDGNNRFVDFEFSLQNADTEVAGKKRYLFKF